MSELTHTDDKGKANMVDVGAKPDQERIARASGKILLAPATLQLIRDNQMKKGDVLTVAKLAGIMGAKQTSNLIPLCHPLPLNHVDVKCTPNPDTSTIDIEATARVSGKTGVEMEALAAVTVAGLTIYDMAKAVDKGMQLTNIRLVYKTGGKSGTFQTEELS